MGGVAGGMAHLYSDPSLTFNDIKKILSAASRGEIEGTEKTDGYNIYLGYVEGKPRAARNKGDMSKGGMDFGTLAALFGFIGELLVPFMASLGVPCGHFWRHWGRLERPGRPGLADAAWPRRAREGCVRSRRARRGRR